MAAEFLLFRLYGPLAAWGEIAVGERRASWNRPSKSAVLGLVAAALGVERDDDAAHRALDGGYGFAVRVDAAGRLLRDYHTAQVPRQKRGRTWPTRRHEVAERTELSTILSNRDYYADALYTAALWGREGALHPLSTVKASLERPRFGLYLGRRSCPLALPLDARVISAQGLVRAFADYTAECGPSDFSSRFAIDKEPLLYWEPDPPGVPPAAGRAVPRRDAVLSRTRWQFAERPEFVTTLAAERE